MKLVPVRELENKMNEIENSSSWSNKIEQMKETKEMSYTSLGNYLRK